MMTATVYVVIFLAGLALLFPLLSTARSPRFAFLAICWMPLAGLALIYALGNRLGYALIVYALVDIVASTVITGIGANQWITAVRQKTGVSSLMMGTLLAASPLAIFAVLIMRAKCEDFAGRSNNYNRTARSSRPSSFLAAGKGKLWRLYNPIE